MTGAGAKLRSVLDRERPVVMPACYDGISAKLIAEAGITVAFMSGFCVAGSRLGMPDTGLISFAEMCDQLRNICNAAPGLLVVGDGDTGYGNAVNVRRTVREYARAGAACVMIEDQVSPKKCGHTKGKAVVDREEARMRIRAAAEEAKEAGVLIMARTDTRATHGIEEAIARSKMFVEEGADIVFLEAPETEAEMREACRQVSAPMMANMVPGGKTPVLPPATLAAMGYRMVLYPLLPFAQVIAGIKGALAAMRTDPARGAASFEEIKTAVGFPEYYALEDRYAARR
ncbi:MAG: isocitrate lyase/PEP mutase family protein [Alphaproteobacteria bacterium]|nr:isocitrate lyase/PEP mutase family protein [Alphaproteobacteria bacterium]